MRQYMYKGLTQLSTIPECSNFKNHLEGWLKHRGLYTPPQISIQEAGVGPANSHS